MNVMGQIKKLQQALVVNKRIININTYQVYSNDQKRFIKVYSLTEIDVKIKRNRAEYRTFCKQAGVKEKPERLRYECGTPAKEFLAY